MVQRIEIGVDKSGVDPALEETAELLRRLGSDSQSTTRLARELALELGEISIENLPDERLRALSGQLANTVVGVEDLYRILDKLGSKADILPDDEVHAFNAAIDELVSQANAASESLRRVDESLKGTGSAHAEKLAEDIGNAGAQAKSAAKSVDALDGEMQGLAGLNLSGLLSKLGKLSDSVEEVHKSSRKADEGLEELGDSASQSSRSAKGSIDRAKRALDELLNVTGRASSSAAQRVRELGDEAESTASRMSASGKSVEQTLGNMSQKAFAGRFAFQQFAFAIDDFVTVLSNGGDLSAALRASANNISSAITMFNPLLGMTSAVAINVGSMAIKYVDWNSLLEKNEQLLRSVSPVLADYANELLRASNAAEMEKLNRTLTSMKRLLMDINGEEVLPHLNTIDAVNERLDRYAKMIKAIGANATDEQMAPIQEQVNLLLARRKKLQAEADREKAEAQRNEKQLRDTIKGIDKDIARTREDDASEQIETLEEIRQRMEDIRRAAIEQSSVDGKLSQDRLTSIREEMQLLRARGEELRRQREAEAEALRRKSEAEIGESGLPQEVIDSVSTEDVAREQAKIAAQRKRQELDAEIAEARQKAEDLTGVDDDEADLQEQKAFALERSKERKVRKEFRSTFKRSVSGTEGGGKEAIEKRTQFIEEIDEQLRRLSDELSEVDTETRSGKGAASTIRRKQDTLRKRRQKLQEKQPSEDVTSDVAEAENRAVAEALKTANITGSLTRAQQTALEKLTRAQVETQRDMEDLENRVESVNRSLDRSGHRANARRAMRSSYR